LSALAVEKPISVYFNNELLTFDVSPKIIDGRTMVPMRVIFEKLGATVSWDGAANTAHAYNYDVMKGVSITIGAPHMVDIYSNVIQLDVPAIVQDGRTFVPLRAVSEAFDCEVQWNEDIQTVNIYSKKGNVFSLEFNDDSIDIIRETIKSNTTPSNGYLYKIGAERVYEQDMSHYTALVYDAKSDEIYIEAVANFDSGNTIANLIYLDGAPERINAQKRVMYLFMEPNGRNTLGSADINPSTFRESSSVVFHYYDSPLGNAVKSEDQQLCTQFTKIGLRETNQIFKFYDLPFDITDLGFVYWRSY